MFGRPELVIDPGDGSGRESPDPADDLAAENRALRARVDELGQRLVREAARRAELEAALDRPGRGAMPGGDGLGDVYVFADDDESTVAFDRFFATPDPHLDKVRGFLLD
jgi:hypothetical protein